MIITDITYGENKIEGKANIPMIDMIQLEAQQLRVVKTLLEADYEPMIKVIENVAIEKFK